MKQVHITTLEGRLQDKGQRKEYRGIYRRTFNINTTFSYITSRYKLCSDSEDEYIVCVVY